MMAGREKIGTTMMIPINLVKRMQVILRKGKERQLDAKIQNESRIRTNSLDDVREEQRKHSIDGSEVLTEPSEDTSDGSRVQPAERRVAGKRREEERAR